MRIFVSYASEQRELAERISLGLENDGHRVFYDRNQLHPGESFDDRIRVAINRCQLLIFLVSQDSLRAGAYTLTELSMIQARWSHPGGRVMPVLLDDTAMDSVPPYLAAVSILEPAGNVVADTLNAVSNYRHRRTRTIAVTLAAAAAVLLLTAGIVWRQLGGRESLAIENITLTAAKDQDGTEAFRFDIRIRNQGDEAFTVVSVLPRIDADGIEFSGTSGEWVNLNAGESKVISVSTSLEAGAGATSFDWRPCYGYVKTESIYTQLNALNMNVDTFMAQHRRESCGSRRTWNRLVGE